MPAAAFASKNRSASLSVMKSAWAEGSGEQARRPRPRRIPPRLLLSPLHPTLASPLAPPQLLHGGCASPVGPPCLEPASSTWAYALAGVEAYA